MENKLKWRIVIGLISLIAGIYFLLKGWPSSVEYIILGAALLAVFAGCGGILGDIFKWLYKPSKGNFRRKGRKRYKKKYKRKY